MRTLPLVSPKRVVPTGNRLAIPSAATKSLGASIALSFRRLEATPFAECPILTTSRVLPPMQQTSLLQLDRNGRLTHQSHKIPINSQSRIKWTDNWGSQLHFHVLSISVSTTLLTKHTKILSKRFKDATTTFTRLSPPSGQSWSGTVPLQSLESPSGFSISARVNFRLVFWLPKFENLR